jgi:hypothetical protein
LKRENAKRLPVRIWVADVNWFLVQLRDAIGENEAAGIGTLLTAKEANHAF